MPEGSITPITQLVLTNAIYFNGQWASPFNTGLTSPENFQLASGSVESVSMMHQESSFSLKYVRLSELFHVGNALSRQ